MRSEADLRHLRRAVELAALGGAAVSPNPRVGAVLVAGGEVVGEGYHRALGEPHAEVEAIRSAGRRSLVGATLYVSLEPCCHHGRTPPCTDAILAAGIRRVVVASDDPSAHANGRGLGILRDEGVAVDVADGELAQQARLLNQPFRKHARSGRPWVIFKAAMSLDGKVATRSGDSRWISGAASRELVHRWRAESDAVAVGIGTVTADDPQLSARVGGSDSDLLAERQPRRVVFDSLARLAAGARLLDDVESLPLTVVTSRAAPRPALDALRARGVGVICATGENEQARVRSALDQLGAEGITSLLLEGGPRLAGVFLDVREIDEVRLFIAPVLLGGRGARAPLEGEGVETVTEALRAQTLECEQLGEDLLLRARLREW
ncbi:bifunctional diaminohydroxyphosphoribosylaminopyrimidine deaminase/5-amino-6-(5-phosphoribosylamino)uracil reductase RibD [Conexibacter sp. S30A1]|uniref:bifunctional diaminohydroxyphosphoribosylaminopyrimidine deaminase/5-amino-6-(5-phosphoribosylamino)uracil reductase RibD n=1 Tax=Conexibacter sp. S30A1 TaxID=2937800 RepID=UPI00200D5762|nr:bifunctional diaminohydroxyphosphoribosylaminopyrimidine deaminase/5-amino-6-(5-phosphoribosylamino)uracil reductase RibD [Conexibacter sp. S30A1]